MSNSNEMVNRSEYYYSLEQVPIPQIAYRFKPTNEDIFFNFGSKKQERLIFPENEGYTGTLHILHSS